MPGIDDFEQEIAQRRAEQRGGPRWYSNEALGQTADRYVGAPLRRAVFPTDAESEQDAAYQRRQKFLAEGLSSPEDLSLEKTAGEAVSRERQYNPNYGGSVTFKTPDRTVVSSQEILKPDELRELRENAGTQQSGSGKGGESKEKGSGGRADFSGVRQAFSEPARQTHFTNDDLGQRHLGLELSRVDPSEYEGLRRNQTIQPEEPRRERTSKAWLTPEDRRAMIASPKGLTTIGGPRSLYDIDATDREMERIRGRHAAELQSISLDDPYDRAQKAQADARQREQAYQDSQPASLDDMNRFGLSGTYTRGEVKKVAQGRAAQDAAEERARIESEGRYRATVDAARIKAADDNTTPGQRREMDAQAHEAEIVRGLQGVPSELQEQAIVDYIKAKAPQFSDILYKRFFRNVAPVSAGP